MALSKATKKKAVKAPGKADAQRKIREDAAKTTSVDKGELIVSDKSKDKGEILPPLSEAEKKIKAVEDDKRFRALETSTRTNFVEMGFILREFKLYNLHEFVQNKQGKKFTSFDSWLKEAAPLSRASGYGALRAAEKLLPIIPKKELEQMPRYSIALLSSLPKLHLQNDVIRKAASTQTKKELVKTIQREAPDAHIEGKKKIVIQVDESSAPIIADAFEAAANLGDVDEKEVLEYICTSWMDSPCELEQYQGMTNRQANNAFVQARDAEAVGKSVSEGQGESDQAEAEQGQG